MSDNTPKPPQGIIRLYHSNNQSPQSLEFSQGAFELDCGGNQPASSPKLSQGLVRLYCYSNQLPKKQKMEIEQQFPFAKV